MINSTTFLDYRRHRYLKLAVAAGIAASLAYLADRPWGTAFFGRTWLGYALGVLSVAITLVLLWYWVRKRRIPDMQDRRCNPQDAPGWAAVPGVRAERRKTHAKQSWRHGATLQGWLSAHVYLGCLLIVLVTLHAGFHFEFNVHTLSYVLLLLIAASGLYGTYAYLNFPSRINRNMGDDTLEGLMRKIAELDELARIRALELPDEVNALVLQARLHTPIGGNALLQLSGRQPDCPTARAVRELPVIGERLIEEGQPKLVRDLYSVLLRKEKMLARARTEIMLKARMQLWLYLHAPLGAAFLAAIVAHVVAVFAYR